MTAYVLVCDQSFASHFSVDNVFLNKELAHTALKKSGGSDASYKLLEFDVELPADRERRREIYEELENEFSGYNPED